MNVVFEMILFPSQQTNSSLFRSCLVFTTF